MSTAAWFSIGEAASLAGFKNPHMADYLARMRIVVPSLAANPGRGRSRLYSFRDVVLLRAMNRLLSQRLPVKKLRKAQAEFDRLHLGSDDMTITPQFLTTDGVDVFYSTDAKDCINLTQNGQMAFAFMLDIRKVSSEIAEPVARLLTQKRRKRTRRSTTK